MCVVGQGELVSDVSGQGRSQETHVQGWLNDDIYPVVLGSRE